MTDKPIIFSAPMVRALLDGRKTQTRRVLKVQPPEPCTFSGFYSVPLTGAFQCRLQGETTLHTQRLPYAPGDKLWVRERFAVSGIGWGKKPREARGGRVHFHAEPDHGWHDYWGSWRPSIHMPRWASRLTLIVTDIRVQRLQDITEADAMAEGVDAVTMEDAPRQAAMSRRSDFARLWNSLHGADSGDANPWVVALNFTVHRCNIDAEATT